MSVTELIENHAADCYPREQQKARLWLFSNELLERAVKNAEHDTEVSNVTVAIRKDLEELRNGS